MNVKERVKIFLDYKKMPISVFEKSINASNGYVNSISKSIGLDKIEMILEKYPNLNIEWLLTGQGNMLKEDAKTNISQTITGDSNIQSGNNTSITGDCKGKIEELQKQLEEYKKQLREKENQVSQLINTVTALSQSKTTK